MSKKSLLELFDSQNPSPELADSLPEFVVDDDNQNFSSISQIFRRQGGISVYGFSYLDFLARREMKFLKNDPFLEKLAAETERDKEFDEYIQFFQQELEQSTALGKSEADNPDADQAAQIEVDVLKQMVWAKLSTLFSIDGDEEAEWKGEIAQFIDRWYKTQEKDNVWQFTILLLRASYYLNKNEAGEDLNQQLNSEEEDYAINLKAAKNEALAKLKASLSLENCLGGDFTALSEFCQQLQFSTSLWQEVKPKLVAEILPYCSSGNWAHIPAWLDFIALGKKSEDRHLFAASVEIMPEDVRRIIVKTVIRRNELAIKYIGMS